MAHRYEFKPGDTVRIAAQPPNQIVPLIGAVGVIGEIRGDYCNIDTYDISPKGLSGGHGTVPLGCLEPFAHPALIQRQQEREEMLREHLELAQKRQASWKKLVEETAAQFKLDTDIVEQIMDIGRSWS